MCKLLLFLLLLTATAVGLPGEGENVRGPLSWSEWVTECSKAQVLYLGEEHTGEIDHLLQRETLQAMAAEKPVVVVAEMFQLVSQKALDDYVQGRLDETELRQSTEWDKRWGHDWELYLPIWQLCKQENIPLRPLRNSSESGKNLSKLGVQAFTPEERQGLAPEPYEFGPHPESLRSTFEAHAGPVSQEAFERFLKVQTLWEEFMAAQIRAALQTPDQPMVIVLVGKGHLLHGLGLPRRVQAQWPQPLRQSVVMVNPTPGERPRTDAWWVYQP